MAQKKIPMRMCVGCREMKPKKELLRVVRTAQGEIAVDRMGGKMSGRGAYLCPQEACLKKAKKSKALEHALEKQMDDALYDELLRKMMRLEIEGER
ncbi:MAG: YlxR family protein [Clostridia bacterium]|nr:YlxR family protein [Clostridia bacterium]